MSIDHFKTSFYVVLHFEAHLLFILKGSTGLSIPCSWTERHAKTIILYRALDALDYENTTLFFSFLIEINNTLKILATMLRRCHVVIKSEPHLGYNLCCHSFNYHQIVVLITGNAIWRCYLS